MQNKINLGFFGDGDWAFNSLLLLLNEKNIIIKFICLRYQKPDFKLIKFAKKNKIKYFILNKINSRFSIKKIKSFNLDIMVSMSYNQKFNKQLIDHCRFGILNCHAGNLPFYRGRSPLNWVLINDEKFFGITVHYVNQKIDRGDIILQKKYSINDKDDYSSIFKKAIQNCPKLLIESLKLVINKKDIPIKQTSISKKGSYFVKRKPGDEIINWNNSSRNIFCFIRGLSKPSVMAKTHLNKREIFINQSEPKFIFNKKNILPGTILTVNKNFFLVKTGDSVIKIKEWYGKVIKGLIFS